MTAMLLFIIIFLYFYLSTYLRNNIKEELVSQAKFIVKHYPTERDLDEHFNLYNLKRAYKYSINITQKRPTNIETFGHNQIKIVKKYPKKEQYLTIKKDIKKLNKTLSHLMWVMVGLVFAGLFFILYYASRISTELMVPIHRLTNRFSNMNESLLKPLTIQGLPLEFTQLGESVNSLITKVKTSIRYRSELYVGTAHELKTPLAVMRLKNQITLMTYKKNDKIREALEQNIESIDTLNNMIHNILEYGRAEGGQFEEPKRVNIIRFMAKKAEEYELLAHSQNRNFIYNFELSSFMISIQPLLFMQIFQNFVQNALKFTPENGLVSLCAKTDKRNFIVEITDEGDGIDESIDLFAPFKRSTESTGAGLGLFLAQNAAESMGVTISLENRKDGQGAVAQIKFPFNRFLHNES